MKWLIVAAIVLLVAGVAFLLLRRRAAASALAPLTTAQLQLREELRRDVTALAAIGERHVFAPESLAAAARFIDQSFAPARVERQRWEHAASGVVVENLVVETRGRSRPEEIVIIGAHYDTVDGTPGADDNASGVAALLALARRFRDATPERTLRFVAFTNEEPPNFKSHEMGSWRYAKQCHERGERVVAMLSLEMLGYYDARRDSQQYPPPLALLYPSTGDFLAFAGNLRSRALVARCVRAFRRAGTMPAQSAALPEVIPQIGWSDQWSFWQFGWPAIMVTDTALFRNPHYHMPDDVPETLDFDRMTRAVDGLQAVVRELAGMRPSD